MYTLLNKYDQMFGLDDPNYSNISINPFYGFGQMPYAEVTLADLDNDNDLDMLVCAAYVCFLSPLHVVGSAWHL